MTITVRLYALLLNYRPNDAGGAPHHPFSVSLPAGATVAELIDVLGIPDGLVTAVAVNQEAVSLTFTLHHGDDVRLFPPSAGG